MTAKACPRGTIELDGKCFIRKHIVKEHYLNQKPYSYRNKKYRIGRMSYGDFFMEPITKKIYGEKDGFAPGTFWLYEIKSKKYENLFQVEE